MKRLSFVQGALLGLAISVVCALAFAILPSLFSTEQVLRWLITAAGLFYMVTLIRTSGQRIGGVTTVVIWAAASTVLFISHAPIVFFLLSHIVFLWLVRSLYFYSSLLSSLVDLGLCFVSFCAAIFAAQHTGNIFLSFWCFFLVQALSSAIPAHFDKDRQAGPIPAEDDLFQQAFRSAEAAMSKLSH